ncbi:Cof-type HAD-IIB family hydrolase [Phaeacidiphilus oryzae]|uniref:Cof-type HAD-IIB family hydrolase n=1 Tax=Phaeacidiphilus oryzae TaxID=348818 RepID=UPI0005604F91|nr:Cof-type HAD-IIB family hydrolase [Phaeacidiphilus oryzae]
MPRTTPAAIAPATTAAATTAPAAITPDIRLVATDMDGTLLDGEGRIPDGLWPRLELLRERGIAFAPASGRQYATLARQFARAGAEALSEMVFIAENGTYVVRDGRELSSAPLDRRTVVDVVRTARGLAAGGADLGVVVCGKRSAYIERRDDAFRSEAATYYAALETVDDVLAPVDEVLKIALYDFQSGERNTAPALRAFAESHQVVVSGQHWVDVLRKDADKGTALRALQRELGVTPAQTMAFGDYLNDLQLLDAADWSYAMAGAHPEIRRRARHEAPAHTDAGVLQVLDRVLGLEG